MIPEDEKAKKIAIAAADVVPYAFYKDEELQGCVTMRPSQGCESVPSLHTDPPTPASPKDPSVLKIVRRSRP